MKWKERLDNFAPPLWEAWVLTLILLLGGGLLVGLLQIVIAVIIPDIGGWQMMLYPLLFLPPLLYIYGATKEKDEERLSKIAPLNIIGNSRFSWWQWMILLTILTLSFAFMFDPLLSWIKMPDSYREFILDVGRYPVCNFIAIVIFAPIFEELFCRGVIMRGLLHYTSPLVAILWSALIFGVIHLNIYQAIPAFLSGLLLGWLYWKTHSIWVVIVLHAINNLLSFLETIFFPGLALESNFKSIVPAKLYYPIVVVSVVVTAVIIFVINRSNEETISSKV